MDQATIYFKRFIPTLLLLLFPFSSALAWGPKGHGLVNQAAILQAPVGNGGFPSFFKTKEAIAWITFLGPEADGWKEHSTESLRASEVPNHFLDFEALGDIELPRDRLTALQRYAAKNRKVEEVGVLPYAILEYFERLKLAFREYRREKAAGQNSLPVQQSILFYAGVMGHYVGDGSQPLHLTIHYDGWKGENPKGYRTEKGLHKKLDDDFVEKFLSLKSFQGMINSPHVINDPFAATLAYFKNSFALFEKIFELEKRGELDRPSAATKEFVAKRLAVGSQMLLDLWWTAWKKSEGEP